MAGAIMAAPVVAASSVWEDALFWNNGAVDLNNDGEWTGNDKAGSTVWRKCDGTSAKSEWPDARHGALQSSTLQIVNYASG